MSIKNCVNPTKHLRHSIFSSGRRQYNTFIESGTRGSWCFDLDKNPWGFIFLHLKSSKSADFEHKRGVPEKGKTENFGCFMAFSCSPNSPNGKFKTKKPVKSTGVFFITFAHPYSRRELLRGRRKPTSSQATARSDFTSKAKRRF